MYDDKNLRAADPVSADVLVEALQKAAGNTKNVYNESIRLNTRTDLVVDTDNVANADYYGYSDIVYAGTTESFLFGPDKGNMKRVLDHGLSLRVVVNLPNTATTGQRLSTLTHEFGVHIVRLSAAVTAIEDTVVATAKEPELARVTKLKELNSHFLASDLYFADAHHVEFGNGESADYNDLKKQVAGALKARSDSIVQKGLRMIGRAPDWAALATQYATATAAGEDLHSELFVHHPAMLKKATESIEIGSTAFNKSKQQKSVLALGGDHVIESLTGLAHKVGLRKKVPPHKNPVHHT
ncbi:hypothetical protein ACFQ1S_10080 [Kibdelosporangium lantanae]|uniref:Uncharacterized protein n=1 Tax=Kibdelosporangium lantanae TaxID=1497396 RepID=A0ABW3M5S6_9PSEU